MAETQARLPVLIEVLSPVHIGTGEKLGRKSFVSEHDSVHIVDDRKLLAVAGASPRLRGAFLRFCEDQQAWLGEYLTQHRVPLGKVKSYTIRMMGQSPREVLPFIKSAGSPPRPYLPGSSLKGALRSALLRSALLDDAQLRAAAADRLQRDLHAHRPPKSPGQSVEQEFFGPDQHRDLMRVFQVADSHPVAASRLQVAEVQALSSTRQHTLKPKSFILSPEVLPAGLCLRGEIIINAYLISKKAQACGLRWDKVQRQRLLDFIIECNRAAEDIIAQEIDFFSRHDERDLVDFYERLQERLAGFEQGMCLLRLGWGTGFDDKAVTDVFDEQLFDQVRETYSLGVGRPGRRGPALDKTLSPKSRKIAFRSDGPPQPLGWLQLRM